MKLNKETRIGILVVASAGGVLAATRIGPAATGKHLLLGLLIAVVVLIARKLLGYPDLTMWGD